MEKQINLNVRLWIALLLLRCSFTIAQPGAGHWKLGGNTNLPAVDDITLPGNNFLGSTGGFNIPLMIGVNGSQDVFVDNLPFAPQILPNSAGSPQGGHWIGLGRIFMHSVGSGANPVLAPKAHLHIHGGNNTPFFGFNSGVRNWFQTGTLCTENSDGMYVGLRDLFPVNGLTNSSYAVINWSDDRFGGSGTDYLSFNFTGGGGLASTNNGMELGRFDPTIGTFGVGNFMFMGYGTEPVRRVEILDADPSTGGNGNAPQLRLTYTYNSNPLNGIWTEFQTTANGDMFFNNWNQNIAQVILRPRYFGFHISNPGNTVEINSNLGGTGTQNNLIPGSWTGSTGATGLRFSDLRPTDQVVPFVPGRFDPTKVFTVDQNGDMILINAVSTPPTNNGISTLPSSQPGGPAIQLGVNCAQIFSQPALLNQATLQTDRFVFLQNKNLIFFDGAPGTGRIGIGNLTTFCGVNNTLEVAADAGSPYSATGATGSSGLRFTYLKSSNSTIPNGTGGVNSAKVLTVDQNGDVVLTDAAGTGLGLCSLPTTQTDLQGDARVGFNQHNVFFDGNSNGVTKNNFIIGNPCTYAPKAKLDVYQKATGSNSIGILSENNDPSASGLNSIAIKGYATGAANAQYVKVAGWFESPGNAAGMQTAIFTPQNGGNWSLGFPTTNSGTGNNSGQLSVAGGIFANAGTWQSSDSSMKHNIVTISNGLDKLLHLRPVTFEWDSIRDSLMVGIHAGFIAQEVQNILPDLVHHVGGSDQISYAQFSPYIVKAIQQQQLSIDSLRGNSAGNNLGNICGAAQNALHNDWEIPLNGKNFLFTSNNSTGNVGIGGYNCAIGDKLTVTGSSVENNTGVHITNVTNNSNSSSYLSLTNDIPGNNAVFTFHSSAFTTPSLFELTTPGNINLSPSFSSDINLKTAGGLVNVNSVNTSNVPANTSLAVHGGAVIENNSGFPSWMQIMNGSNQMVYLGSNNSYGQLNLYDGSSASPALISISAFPGQHNWFNSGTFLGINTNSPGVMLDVNGTVRAVSYATSDSTLKTNITALSAGALSKVKNFRAVSYDWISPEDTAMYGAQYGFTAQQMETIVPGLVKTDKDGKKILSYNGVIAFLTKALQEQQAQIDSMKSVMTSCCNNNSRTTNSNTTNSVDVELSDVDIVVLNQNQPNPFAEQTTITYQIPQASNFAQILFYDVNGRQIKAVDINKKGKGQLNVFANDLSNGVYSYTLVIDGKIIETKKMIKQQ